MRRLAALLPLLLCSSLITAACGRERETNLPDSPYRSGFLTRDEGETYTLSVKGSSVTVRGPGNDAIPGSNTRMVFWEAGAEPAIDQSTCATWTSQTGDLDQQGVVLRAHMIRDSMRAITVTRNVWFGAGWLFNVHLWDTGIPGVPLAHAQFDLRETIFDATTGKTRPLPWRLCAHVAGARLDFKVWPLSSPEPEWSDSRFAGSTLLPKEWVHPGWAGWYAGHLAQDHEIVYSDLVTGTSSE